MSISSPVIYFYKTENVNFLNTVTSDFLYWEIHSDKSWCEVKRKNETVISISVSDNITKKSREASVKIQYGNIIRIITVYQGGYDVGDYYNEEHIQGIVYETDTYGMHGKIVSLDESECKWSIDSDMLITQSRDYDDGENNMEQIKRINNWQSLYPAFYWCDLKNKNGIDGWYLPAIDEILKIKSNTKKLNANLIFYGTTLDDNNLYYWSSTEHENSLDAYVSFYKKLSEDMISYGSVSKGKSNIYKVRAIRKI